MKTQIERLCAVLLAVMFVVTLFQVVARVVIGMSSVWSEELARFLYVCLVFIGAAPLIRDDEHIRVGVLTDRLTGRPAALLKAVIALLAISDDSLHRGHDAGGVDKYPWPTGPPMPRRWTG